MDFMSDLILDDHWMIMSLNLKQGKGNFNFICQYKMGKNRSNLTGLRWTVPKNVC